MGVKIKLTEDGRVPEEAMRVLTAFAEHRDVCDQCGQAYAKAARAEAYCTTGYELLRELGKQDGVYEY